MEQNTILLRGQLRALPEFSHENHGRRFYRFYLEVPRLSSAVDVIPVIAEESILNRLEPDAGSMLRVEGQIRSHNDRRSGTRHLLVFVFASSVTAEDGNSVNDVELEGVLCREPSYRRTPLGREICDCMLAIPRSYHRSDYLPCILWGRTAQEISQMHTGGRLHLWGRLQSREYQKESPEGTITRVTYEISALQAEEVGEE